MQQRTKSKNRWRLGIIMLILSQVLTSCLSLKRTSELGDFPEPYDVNGNLVVVYGDITEDTEHTLIIQKVGPNDEEAKNPVVTMPLWYWKKIVRFAVDAKGVEK